MVIILCLVAILGIIGVMFAYFSGKQQDRRIDSSEVLDYSSGGNAGTININTAQDAASICTSTCPLPTEATTEETNTTQAATYSTDSTPSTDSTSLSDLVTDYEPISMPTFDRDSPTLQTPPSPSCGADAGSSYYANCMDSYCRSYPETPVCLSRL